MKEVFEVILATENRLNPVTKISARRHFLPMDYRPLEGAIFSLIQAAGTGSAGNQYLFLIWARKFVRLSTSK